MRVMRWVPAAAAVALDSVLNTLAAGRYPDSLSVRPLISPPHT